MSPPGRLRRRLALFFFLKIRRAVSQGRSYGLQGWSAGRSGLAEHRFRSGRAGPGPCGCCNTPPWIRCHSLSQHRGCRPGALGYLGNDCLHSTRGRQLIRQLRLEQLDHEEAYEGDDDVLDHECGAGAGCRV